MSIRNRAGRKAWQTRVEFYRTVGTVATALANTEFKYGRETTKEMIIERTVLIGGQKQVITFNQAYGELFDWVGKAFSNRSDLGLSDALVEIFKQGSRIFTKKAVYRLWVKP